MPAISKIAAIKSISKLILIRARTISFETSFFDSIESDVFALSLSIGLSGACQQCDKYIFKYVI